MRWDDIVGASIGLLLGGYNIKRLWHSNMEALNILDVFFINFSLCIVCYFLNPDINNFNMYFLNGKGFVTSYEKGIVNSSDYFPESPLMFFLFAVSFLFSTLSLIVYTWITRISKNHLPPSSSQLSTLSISVTPKNLSTK